MCDKKIDSLDAPKLSNPTYLCCQTQNEAQIQATHLTVYLYSTLVYHKIVGNNFNQ